MIGKSIRVLKRLASNNDYLRALHARTRFFFEVPIEDYGTKKKKIITTVKPYTRLPYRRLSKLYETAMYLEKEEIEGSFVECGVWNGGSAGVVASVFNSNKNRDIWLFDSWQGLPEPTEHDISYLGVLASERWEKGYLKGSEEKVRELFLEKLNIEKSKTHIIRGWFDKTIPPLTEKIGKIALLHLDCDWYESVKVCLKELYDNVVKGGFIFVDDYGQWMGSKRAVDEFIEERNLRKKFIDIDGKGVYFQI